MLFRSAARPAQPGREGQIERREQRREIVVDTHCLAFGAKRRYAALGQCCEARFGEKKLIRWPIHFDQGPLRYPGPSARLAFHSTATYASLRPRDRSMGRGQEAHVREFPMSRITGSPPVQRKTRWQSRTVMRPVMAALLVASFIDRKSTRLNSSHSSVSRMPSSA